MFIRKVAGFREVPLGTARSLRYGVPASVARRIRLPGSFALATATAFPRVRAWMGERATRSVRMAAAFLAMSALAFAYALSLSLAADFSWHLICVQRILLVPSLVALWMAMAAPPQAVPKG